MSTTPSVRIDIWSDYVCPFCYLELPIIDQLQELYGRSLIVNWRAFELRPEPTPMLEPQGEYLRATWERSVFPMAQRRGRPIKLPPIQPRSRIAFEAAEFARERFSFDGMHRALFRAFFEEGRDIGDAEVLEDIASGVGLDRKALRSALATQRYTDRVLQDQMAARQLGLRAVPAMLLRRFAEPLQQARVFGGAMAYEQVNAAVATLSAK
jgi:predicted DsbA family dithiol-disulfide isomerase